ncbi:MAG: AAA family ATPase [Pirellulales bacterium]|nr:AAA family ATPase [Pirellulales bacterium]
MSFDLSSLFAPVAASPALSAGAVGSVETLPASTEKKSTPYRFLPPEPRTLADAGLSPGELDGLLLKLLLQRGTTTGRGAAETTRLPRTLVAEGFERLRVELLVALKGSSGIEDFVFQLTDAGHDRARRLAHHATYADAAPVPLEQYVAAVHRQSLADSRLERSNLVAAFSGLRLDDDLLSQVGQAVNDGRGMFLFGPPGNGKTSISERVVGAYGEYVWIPRMITIDGELVRLYDPRCHKAAPLPQLADLTYDRRWVLVERPTIVVGGELTMAHLELQHNPTTGVCEAPVQLRANCGALVVDDFGRQRAATSEILNRLIVPMEKQHDYLLLASGRQAALPFDMLLVFSTNLEPRDLVDEAFLRRIPYKIEVGGPSETEFVELFVALARDAACACPPETIGELIARHYRPRQRPLRYCHPRDLLRQVRNYCQYRDLPLEVTAEALDVAVKNYFSAL